VTPSSQAPQPYIMQLPRRWDDAVALDGCTTRHAGIILSFLIMNEERVRPGVLYIELGG
jgi:hypothetical protein